MDIDVREDNTEIVTKGIADAIVRGLEKIGLMAEGYAKLAVPVDTGRLRNSITHAQNGKDTVIVGTNVKYAPFVEMGTRKQKAQPYLKPAAQNHAEQYRKILHDELGS